MKFYLKISLGIVFFSCAAETTQDFDGETIKTQLSFENENECNMYNSFLF